MGQSALFAQRAVRDQFSHLWDAEVSVFSQWGEDGILDFLCDAVGLARPRVVEFGAGNFTECNSRGLAEFRNAAVLAVDTREDLPATLVANEIGWRTTVIPRVEWITPFSAPVAMDVARSHFGEVDIVSLDIDGNDYWVAQSLDLREVRVVVVEYNAGFGSDWSVTVPRDDQFDRTSAHYSWVYYGASLRAFVDLMASKGFVFVGTNKACNNAFFVSGQCLPTQLVLPGEDLSAFTDVRFREARNASGVLCLEHPSEVLRRSPELALIDVASGQPTTVGAVLGY